VREKAISLVLDPHGFVFDTEHTFRGLTISEKDNGYNIILRAYSRDGSAVYAMTHADDPQWGLECLWEAILKGNGYTLWRPDRFASIRGGE
jgi:hypothetical protein